MADQLRVLFIPFSLAGHMIPMVDMARLFAAQSSVDVTVVSTAENAVVLEDLVAGDKVRILTLPMPSDLSAPSSDELSRAIGLLRDDRPDCIVSDVFHFWTADVAADLGVPRLSFHGSGYFHSCAARSKVESGDEDGSVVLAGLPDRITMLRTQILDWTAFASEFIEALADSEKRTYGAIMNSFEELEPGYAAHYRATIGTKDWSVGPVSLWANRAENDKCNRGKILKVEESLCNDIVTWLDSKREMSVVYVCFGSLARFPGKQLWEIARALESCGHSFIWVVRKRESDEYDQVFPEGFEERMKESQRGFVVRDWAPQMAILDHPAVGVMVSHCGWNSVIECVTSGIPMVTWPLFADQFYNEKLVTEILRVGVGVGVKEWSFDWIHLDRRIVERDEIEKAVSVLMGKGNEALEMRLRAKRLAEQARKAVNFGGPSQRNLMALIDELKSLKIART